MHIRTCTDGNYYSHYFVLRDSLEIWGQVTSTLTLRLPVGLLTSKSTVLDLFQGHLLGLTLSIPSSALRAT